MANVITRTIQKIDSFQRQHVVPGFFYAVIKKYGEDNGGYQSAIITYYGLLSLFPLLIVFTSLTQLLLKGNPSLRMRFSASVTHYFPIIGNQLQQAVHSPKKTGLTLVVSLLITLFGARGGASAFQYVINSVWPTSSIKQPPFLKNVLRSFGIIGAGGIGLATASILSGYTTALGHGIIINILATLLSVVILWLTFIVLFKLALNGHEYVHDIMIGAGVAAVGLQVLQTAGSAILAHQLKGLSTTYGTFALVIGLLFWIYLQAQVILYAVEIEVIRTYHLFPRSLQGELTDGDQLAQATNRHSNERVNVRYRKVKQNNDFN